MKQITMILFVLSILAMILGTISDWSDRLFIVSQSNYWYIGLYLLVLAIFVEMFWQ